MSTRRTAPDYTLYLAVDPSYGITLMRQIDFADVAIDEPAFVSQVCRVLPRQSIVRAHASERFPDESYVLRRRQLEDVRREIGRLIHAGTHGTQVHALRPVDLAGVLRHYGLRVQPSGAGVSVQVFTEYGCAARAWLRKA